MPNALKALSDRPVRENGTSRYCIAGVAMTSHIIKIQLFSFLKTPTTILPATFLAGVFPVFVIFVGTRNGLFKVIVRLSPVNTKAIHARSSRLKFLSASATPWLEISLACLTLVQIRF